MTNDRFDGFTIHEYADYIYENSNDWADAREYLNNSRMLEGVSPAYKVSLYTILCALNSSKGYFGGACNEFSI